MHDGRNDSGAGPELALERSGLRFRSSVEEVRYRDWYLDEARSVSVTAFAGAIVMWFGALVAVSLVFDDGLTRGAPICVGLMAYNAAALGIARQDRFRRSVLLVAASTNLVAGLSLIALGRGLLLGDAELTALTGVMVVIIFFGFIQLRLHPTLAAVSVGISQVTFLVMAFAQRDDVTEPSTRFWLAVVTILLAYLGALFMCVLIERQMRARYVGERTIDWQATVIDHERARADHLLAHMLPAPIIDRLKQSPGVIADSHDDVSVLFADIIGFTPLSTRLAADELVDLLNHLFSAFDALAEELGVTKLRTIGDGYMVVAGLPAPREDHANALVALGLELLAFVASDPRCAAEGLQLRIGVNSGAVIAGVIGTSAFQYDVWGDTVNTAARMESHGVPGRVQITASTHEHVARTYACDPRGTIDVKGKGPLDAWLVVGPIR